MAGVTTSPRLRRAGQEVASGDFLGAPLPAVNQSPQARRTHTAPPGKKAGSARGQPRGAVGSPAGAPLRN